MQRRFWKHFLILAFLGFIQTVAAQITDGANIFSGGDIGSILVNFIDAITLVEIDTIAQAALFSAVIAIFYFASLNIFEQVFLRLEEIIKEAMSGNARGIHGDGYPTGVKGMAFAVAFISANGITGLIGLLAATAMGLLALLIVLIVQGKLLGILSSFGIIEDVRTAPTTVTTPDNNNTPEPSNTTTSSPDSINDPRSLSDNIDDMSSRNPGGDVPRDTQTPDDINGPDKTGTTMTESDSMEQAFQGLADHLDNEIGRGEKELEELKDAKRALSDALNQILEHERLIDLAVELEDRAFHQNDMSGMKLHQQLNEMMESVGLEAGQEDQILQREAALIDKINEDLHQAALDLKQVLSDEQDDMQEDKGTLQELEKVEEHLKDLEEAARSAEKALSQ